MTRVVRRVDGVVIDIPCSKIMMTEYDDRSCSSCSSYSIDFDFSSDFLNEEFTKGELDVDGEYCYQYLQEQHEKQ